MKFLIKRILNFLFRLVHNVCVTNKKYIKDIKYIRRKNCDIFFGYYDHSPISDDGSKIIYTCYDKKTKTYNVEVRELLTEKIIYTKSCSIVNKQQGNRLMWFPGKPSKVIYNDLVNGKIVCKITDISSGDQLSKPYPVYDVCPAGLYAVALDFKILEKYRPGYGYKLPGNEVDFSGELKLDVYNFQTDEHICSVTEKQILEILNYKHKNYHSTYFNHVCFSPCGRKFLFFYIGVVENKNFLYSLVYDIPECNIKCIEESDVASHYSWRDSNALLLTILKPKGAEYRVYDLSGKYIKLDNVNLTNDGHPSFLEDNCIISDTYPNKLGFQSLFFCNIKTNFGDKLLKILAYPVRNPVNRTDLHPRLCPKNKIVIDSNIGGDRSIIVLDYERLCNNNHSIQQN